MLPTSRSLGGTVDGPALCMSGKCVQLVHCHLALSTPTLNAEEAVSNTTCRPRSLMPPNQEETSTRPLSYLVTTSSQAGCTGQIVMMTCTVNIMTIHMHCRLFTFPKTPKRFPCCVIPCGPPWRAFVKGADEQICCACWWMNRFEAVLLRGCLLGTRLLDSFVPRPLSQYCSRPVCAI